MKLELVIRLEADEAKIGACEKVKTSVQSGQCSRKGMELDFLACYCGITSHLVGT